MARKKVRLQNEVWTYMTSIKVSINIASVLCNNTTTTPTSNNEGNTDGNNEKTNNLQSTAKYEEKLSSITLLFYSNMTIPGSTPPSLLSPVRGSSSNTSSTNTTANNYTTFKKHFTKLIRDKENSLKKLQHIRKIDFHVGTKEDTTMKITINTGVLNANIGHSKMTRNHDNSDIESTTVSNILQMICSRIYSSIYL